MDICYFSAEHIWDRNILLDKNEVHVWLADLRNYDEHLMGILANLLSSEENNRMFRYLHEADRNRFLVGHGLLRLLLSRYLQQRPMDITFSTSKHGKLYISQSDLSFNISHSGNMIALSFVKGKSVGIDVEQMHTLNEHIQIAKNFFSPQELTQIISEKNEEKKQECFYKIWTVKEAYVKAIGFGLTRSLKTFEVLNDGGIKDFSCKKRYQYYSKNLDENYICSIVVV